METNTQKTRILKALEGYGRDEGIAFVSEADAQRYWGGLVDIIGTLITEAVDAALSPPPGSPCVCFPESCACPRHAVPESTPNTV